QSPNQNDAFYLGTKLHGSRGARPEGLTENIFLSSKIGVSQDYFSVNNRFLFKIGEFIDKFHRQFLIAKSLPNTVNEMMKEAQRNVFRLIGLTSTAHVRRGFIEILKEPLLKHINNGIIDALIRCLGKCLQMRKHACHDEKTRLMMKAPPPSTTDFQPNDRSFLFASTRTSASILKGRLARP
ncbi:12531_t:CDS:2, partial [Acaulospora morrowiae]